MASIFLQRNGGDADRQAAGATMAWENHKKRVKRSRRELRSNPGESEVDQAPPKSGNYRLGTVAYLQVRKYLRDVALNRRLCDA